VLSSRSAFHYFDTVFASVSLASVRLLSLPLAFVSLPFAFVFTRFRFRFAFFRFRFASFRFRFHSLPLSIRFLSLSFRFLSLSFSLASAFGSLPFAFVALLFFQAAGVLEWIGSNGRRCEWSNPARAKLVAVSTSMGAAAACQGDPDNVAGGHAQTINRSQGDRGGDDEQREREHAHAFHCMRVSEKIRRNKMT
jgi:hypothetical protein